MNHAAAKDIAIKLCYQLQPFCEKINIAGSVRRQKPEVKDIEVILLPKTITVCQDTLFGGGDGIKEVCADFIRQINSLGKIIKGKPTGKMMQIQLPEIMLDLFIPDDFDYYRQYAIRTGSRDYSQRVIAGGWLKAGWCGSDQGLRKQSDCIKRKKPDGKTEWICRNKKAELPPAWTSEEHFFQFIGAKYIHPSYRNF